MNAMMGDTTLLKTGVTLRRRLCLNLFVIFASSFLLLSALSVHAAGFATNFQSELSTWTGQNTGSCAFGQCVSHNGNSDPTPFAETVVKIDGVWYFHTIVGDPASGFAMEAYNRAANVDTGTVPVGDIQSNGTGFSPDGGGNLTSVIGNFGIGRTPSTIGVLHGDLNSANPLGDYRVSGTGGNAPDHTAFRMIMTSPSGDMSMEVVKPFLDKKPKISQTVQDAGMTATFITDERALNYHQSGTAAPVTNTLVLNDPSIPGSGAADFSMDLAQQADITAGRFTYTPGTGYSNAENDPSLGWNSTDSNFDFGTYSYVDSQGFDAINYDWSQVFDYSQNAISCSTYPTAGNAFIRDQSGNFGGSCFNKP